MRRVFTIVMLVVLAALTPAAGTAQLATPPPGAEAPGPEECQVSPSAPQAVLAVLATPAAEPEGAASDLPASGGQLTVGSEDEFPTGEPADAPTADAAAAVVNEFAACLNARDVFRLFSLLSDDLVRTLGTEVGLEMESPADWATAAAAQPTPAPESARLVLLEIRDARVLPDGRVGMVLVQDALDDEEGPRSSLVVLVEMDGRWLVDAVVLVDPEASYP